MNITCPKCHFSKAVDPGRIPDRPVRVNCPKCGDSFILDTSLPPEDADQAHAADGQTTAAPRPQRSPQSPLPAADAAHRIICSACGTVQAPAAHCRLCGATIIVTARPVEKRLFAGFWNRLVAYVIDFLLRGVVVLVLSQLFGVTLDMLDIAGTGDPSVALVFILFWASLWIGYTVFFTGYCGQTPGKMAIRIKVIRTDGTSIGFGRAILREAVGKFFSWLLLGIGFLMIAFDSKKQGLHDKLADTCVIKL